jgi:hypothetical protein
LRAPVKYKKKTGTQWYPGQVNSPIWRMAIGPAQPTFAVPRRAPRRLGTFPYWIEIVINAGPKCKTNTSLWLLVAEDYIQTGYQARKIGYNLERIGHA